MPVCAKAKPMPLAWNMRLLLLVGLCLGSPLAQSQAEDETSDAEEITVQNASTRLVDDVYVLNAEIDYAFTPVVLDALENGVPITIEMRIEILRERQWFWDVEFAVVEQRYRLQYHALSELYLVKNLNTGVRSNFPTRRAALGAIGAISDFPLLDSRLLDGEKQYMARLRTRLDIGALPTPLQLLAYISPEWHLESEWYAWPLKS